MAFDLYTTVVLGTGLLAILWILVAFRAAPEIWSRWWAWRPVDVDGQRRLFTHVMRRRSGDAWEYRDLSPDELREHDKDRADYQTW